MKCRNVRYKLNFNTNDIVVLFWKKNMYKINIILYVINEQNNSQI